MIHRTDYLAIADGMRLLTTRPKKKKRERKCVICCQESRGKRNTCSATFYTSIDVVPLSQHCARYKLLLALIEITTSDLSSRIFIYLDICRDYHERASTFFSHVTDASSSYKGGWSHATSPAPGQGKFLSNLPFSQYLR